MTALAADDKAIHGHALTLQTLGKLEHWLALDSFLEPKFSAPILLIHYVFEIMVERHGIQIAPAMLKVVMRLMTMSMDGQDDGRFQEMVEEVKAAVVS